MDSLKHFDVLLIKHDQPGMAATYINFYRDEELSDLQMADLLKNLPARVATKCPEFHAKRLAEALARTGGEVRLLPCL